MKQIIKKPVITEKSYNLSALGKYVFEVNDNANKNEIKQTVSRHFKVDVISVNLTKRKVKESQHGRQKRIKPGKKIAIVTLKKDQKIDLFEEQSK